MVIPESTGCNEAEQAFLGCLLRLPASTVLRLTERVRVEDFVDPANRVLLGACVAVAVAGHDPDPTLVVLELRRRGCERSFTSHQGAGQYALEVFTAAGVPAVVDAYLQGLLEHSYRRRVQEVGVRLQQVAESGHTLEEVRELADEQHRLLAEAWVRLQPEERRPARLEVAS